MPGHTLTLEQFAIYAREQIRTIDGLLSGHRTAGEVFCRCGRPRPCPQARSLTATREHYRHRIAGLDDQTRLLPIIAPPPDWPRHRRRAAVLALLRRLKSCVSAGGTEAATTQRPGTPSAGIAREGVLGVRLPIGPYLADQHREN